MDVAQLEQLQTLRHQQDVLTEQSQAVRKLLQEYDAMDSALTTSYVDLGDSQWTGPGSTGQYTRNTTTERSQTLKSLCQKQRRTAQILKAMDNNAGGDLLTATATDRRVVITLEDVQETARLPPHSRLIDYQHLKERLPSQIKLQELRKEQSKQLAEAHDKYRVASKGAPCSILAIKAKACCKQLTSWSWRVRARVPVVTLWRTWIESAAAERRAFHAAKVYNLKRRQRIVRNSMPVASTVGILTLPWGSACQALHRLSWFVALRKHAQQCQITTLVDRLDKVGFACRQLYGVRRRCL